jgi:hypothetical protein
MKTLSKLGALTVHSTLSISWPRHFHNNFVIIFFIFHLDIPYTLYGLQMVNFGLFNLRQD